MFFFCHWQLGYDANNKAFDGFINVVVVLDWIMQLSIGDFYLSFSKYVKEKDITSE